MQKSHPNPPNKVIPHYESSLQKKIETKYSFPPEKPDQWWSSRSIPIQFALLKYYPKYCHRLQLDQSPRPWPLFSRIRQIKTLNHFEENCGDSIKGREVIITKRVKSLLRHKRKSLKSLPVVEVGYYHRDCIMEMCPFFPRVQTLEVSLQTEDFSRSLQKEIEKAYGYFWHTFRHVQHLRILSGCTPLLCFLLQKVTSDKKFLSSLKSFNLRFFGSQFQISLQKKELLQDITHLTFASFDDFHSDRDQIKVILNDYPKLFSFNFPINSDSTLAPFQPLQNIGVLALRIFDVWGFIQTFEPPLFLQELTLHIDYASNWRPLWNDLYEESPEGQLLIKNIEKHQTWLNFFLRGLIR